MIIAKRLDVPFNHQQTEFLAATHQHEAALKQNLVNTLERNNEMKYTITTCRCKFGKSNKKQMCDVHKDEKICYRDFPRSKSSSWKSARNFVDEMISDVWRRNEQPYELRTKLRPQALHQEDVTQHQRQPYAGLHQHWTRLVDTTTSRNAWRISGCSFSHWTRNWTTSTKTIIASTRITTPQQRQSKCWCSSPNEPDKFGLGLDESNLSVSSAVVISCFSQELTYKRLFRCIRQRETETNSWHRNDCEEVEQQLSRHWPSTNTSTELWSWKRARRTVSARPLHN